MQGSATRSVLYYKNIYLCAIRFFRRYAILPTNENIRKPLDQLWKRLVALYKKLVYGIALVGRWDA